jgi:hypothetical protein
MESCSGDFVEAGVRGVGTVDDSLHEDVALSQRGIA